MKTVTWTRRECFRRFRGLPTKIGTGWIFDTRNFIKVSLAVSLITFYSANWGPILLCLTLDFPQKYPEMQFLAIVRWLFLHKHWLFAQTFPRTLMTLATLNVLSLQLSKILSDPLSTSHWSFGCSPEAKQDERDIWDDDVLYMLIDRQPRKRWEIWNKETRNAKYRHAILFWDSSFRKCLTRLFMTW